MLEFIRSGDHVRSEYIDLCLDETNNRSAFLLQELAHDVATRSRVEPARVPDKNMLS